ncbi:MAG TPA: hypothetical protein VFA82_00740 [Gaiellaceae bacterium]|nr:hypothetical protein [Gaiellaceae bacterium]
MTQTVRRYVAATVVVTVVAAVSAAFALGTASRPAAAPGGVQVFAGPPLRTAPPGVSHQADALAFFPRVTTITAGQSVTFNVLGFHTVTFGKQSAFPLVVPQKGLQPATADAAGQPLWWAGKAPLLGLNPKAVPQLGGSTISSPSQVASSGLQRVLTASAKHPPKPYTLTFAKPGLYRFFCIVHPGMTGAIRVLPATATAPSPAQLESRVKAQLGRTIGDLKTIQSQNPTDPLTVWVGAGKLDGSEVTAFFPQRLVVKTGDTVKFVSHDPTDIHTVTFGPPAYTTGIENTFVTPKGVNPFGAFPSEPPAAPGAPVTFDGSNHGNGYVNSGLVNPYSVKATPHLFRVTFTKAGVYHFECVIHPNMDGTIVVQ